MLKPIVTENLRILFVGMNPSPYSSKVHHYFASSTMFWYLLEQAGLTHGRIWDSELLKHNYGIMNLIDRPTRYAKEIGEAEWFAGVMRLKEIIKDYKPQVVCFLGKLPAQKYFGTEDIKYGLLNEEDNGTKFFVVIFPTFACSTDLKLKYLRELRDLV